MIVSYAKSLGLVIEFDADETKFGIAVLGRILELAKDLSDAGEVDEDQFIFDLEAAHKEILDNEYSPVQ